MKEDGRLLSLLGRIVSAGYTLDDVKEAWPHIVGDRIRSLYGRDVARLGLSDVVVVVDQARERVPLLGVSSYHMYVERRGVVVRILLSTGRSANGSVSLASGELERVSQAVKKTGRVSDRLLSSLDGPKTIATLASETGMTKPTVHRHLTDLRRRGLVRLLRRGLYSATNMGKQYGGK